MKPRRLYGFALLGLLAWLGTLPWIAEILAYGLNQPAPSWVDFVVVGAVGMMALSVLLWICALCSGWLGRRMRVWLPGVLLGTAVYGWLAVNVVLQPQAVFTDWSMLPRMLVSIAPLALEGWLLISLPLYWKLTRL
ncbi:hypothetical protein SAMN05443662_0184 [Sulfurivirga caldicuralii]|uniref:Uncharacterized protein n=1 Tax=Sulfurivirga caldicuralii TaxID=364032 RepID=A0A1N6DJ38_9GAMM|nr:hypothetical protein [Sulfurivirga caldicuralii]SIN70736.1 hypothetical protein SAMN05443662_0184 [Sulfurivirga caldicuralii]